MTRWEPNARGRLERAALELYGERGFEATTVAEIATRAGLTERTFFRHFADKREVLFGGAHELEAQIVGAVRTAPSDAAPLDAVAGAFAAMAGGFEARRELARRRQAIIAATPELTERELIKLASLAAAIARALRARGVEEPVASLSAEAGTAVFRIAFERWVDAEERRDLAHVLRDSLEDLRTVAAQRS